MTSSALIVLLPVLLAGCTMFENTLKMDRETNQEFQDVRDAFAPREAPIEQEQARNNIPEFTDYTSTNAANLKPMPLVSVSVNETIPLKDVLYELAQQANYDLEIDPRIDGAIIFSARNRPFDEVMSRIADLASLRFKFENDVVRVEMDTPYSETYKIDYLPMARTVSTTVQNNASFAGSGSSEGGGSATSSSGSTFSLSGTTEVDFWKELDTNIKQILESNSLENALRTNQTPVVTVAPVAQPPAPVDSTTTTDSGVPAVPTDATAPPAAPAVVVAPTAPTDTPSVEITPTYSVNKQAGLLSVFANEKVHKKIATYLTELRQSVSSQVLIEAKVLEVNLNDNVATGINWDRIGNWGDLSLQAGSNILSLSDTDANSGGFTATIDGSDVESVIKAVSQYGTVHALSSPRLTVLNKQSAVLNVATNRVYFQISQEETTQDDTGNTAGGGITVETRSVPEGILVNVTPSIDPAKGEIVLNLRPTITRIEGTVNDPSIALINNANGGNALPDGLVNAIPELGVQEFDSILKVRSGEAVVMGGLIRDRTDSNQLGVPVLSEMPLIGSLFKGSNNEISKSEIVVFLKATIINDGKDSIHQTDRDLYKTFSQDRRPLPM